MTLTMNWCLTLVYPKREIKWKTFWGSEEDVQKLADEVVTDEEFFDHDYGGQPTLMYERIDLESFSAPNDYERGWQDGYDAGSGLAQETAYEQGYEAGLKAGKENK